MRPDTWTRAVLTASAEDRYVTCSGCGGSGEVRNPYFPQKRDTCSRCHGNGEVRK